MGVNFQEPRFTTLKMKLLKTVLKEKILKELEYTDKDLSGVFGHFKQYLKVNVEEKVKLTLLDLNTCVMINRWT